MGKVQELKNFSVKKMVVVFTMLTTLAFFVVAVADSLDCEDPVHPDYCIVKDKLREELPANQLPFPVTIDVDVAVKINIVILISFSPL